MWSRVRHSNRSRRVLVTPLGVRHESSWIGDSWRWLFGSDAAGVSGAHRYLVIVTAAHRAGAGDVRKRQFQAGRYDGVEAEHFLGKPRQAVRVPSKEELLKWKNYSAPRAKKELPDWAK